jgi:HEAT repeat protein/cyclophilin family peptidyl-prolyl cis-trans isomerase
VLTHYISSHIQRSTAVHLRDCPRRGSPRRFGRAAPLRASVLTNVLAGVLAGVLASGCASAPPPAAPTISYEQKLAWIIRLEDQRLLRDPAPAPPPVPAVPSKKKSLTPPAAPTPDLLKLITDTDARLRRRVALAIGRVGLAEGVPALTAALKDADADVRQMAAFGLGLLADPGAAPALLEALKGDASPLVRGRAAEAIGLIGADKLGAPGAADAATAIGAMVATQVGSGALNAIQPDDLSYPLAPPVEAFRLGLYALARLKAYDPMAMAVLNGSGQPTIRWWPVAYALQRVGDKRALPALMLLAREHGSYTAAFAARGLGALKDPAALDVLLPLVQQNDLNPRVRFRVIEALGAIGDKRAIQPLIAVLDQPTLDPTLRLAVVTSLGQLHAEQASDRLLDLTGDRWPTLRAAALRALATANPEYFVTVLSTSDPDPDWVVRAAMAELLGSLGQVDLHPTMRAMLQDSDQRVVPAVLKALAHIKAPDINTILLERLKADDAVIRGTAADLLGDLKPEGAAAALQAAWQAAQADNTYTVRGSIIQALVKIGPDAARDTLKRALTDKDWALRVKAAELLKKIEPSLDVETAIRPAPTTVDRATYDTLASPKVSPHIYIDTKKGSIEIELAMLDAPLTSYNILTLARKGFFNNFRIHRVVPDFVVQDGDPRGDGEGGPNYTIRDELNDLPYLRGTVGMALDWKDTGGSQYFLTISPQPHLDAKYTIFGRVVKGIEVVDQLQQWDTIDRIRVWDGVQMSMRSQQP